MKKIITITYIIFMLMGNQALAQKIKLAKADKDYENYAYVDAIKTYERLVEKGLNSADLYEKIANSYFYNADLKNAGKWYGKLIEIDPNANDEYFFRYANCLRSIGNMEESKRILEIYNQKSKDNKGILYEREIKFIDNIEANSNRYNIKNLTINSPYSDYGSTIYNDSILVFTSARDTSGSKSLKHTWTNQSFTDLYEYDLTTNNNKVQKFSKKIQTKFNEASAVFTKDGKTMYFTRNNYLKGNRGKDKNNTTLIKIYKSTLNNNEWSNIIELPFNSDNWSTAHPTLSPDEKFLYFVSDRPETLGGSDIFKSEIMANGNYGVPINLGNIINTPGRESFPYISAEYDLYFASDTHSGLGGLDIFVSTLDTLTGEFGEVQNLGRDINSTKDDFAYIINSETRKGFFTSNRDGGNGFDDIYEFLELKPILKPVIVGYTVDMETNFAIAAAKLYLYDSNHQLLDSTYSDDQGKYTFNVKNNQNYTVTAEKQDYIKNGKSISIPKYELINELNIALDKNKCKLIIGGDLAKCFGISMIYFDLDKANIREDAAEDLSKILDVLIQYPNMRIDIRSHTDSRASFKYNEELSDRRANSTKRWLVEHGINPNRLTAKGYGEYRLINKCSDDVKCTEAEHQLNRRSEFIITAL